MTEMHSPKTKSSYYINSAVGLLIMLAGSVLSPIEPLSEVGMKMVFIFLGTLYLWCTVDIVWPSILSLCVLVISGCMTPAAMIKASFGDPNLCFFLFSMIFFGAFQEVGVSVYISNWFLSRKIINGRPLVFCYIIIFTAYALSVVTGPLPPLLILWPIIYDICAKLGYDKKDKFVPIMVFGIFFGAVLGQPAIPIRGGVLVTLTTFQSISGLPMPFSQLLIYNLITSVILIGLYVLLIKFIFKADLGKLKNIRTDLYETDELPPLNVQQIIMSVAVVLFILVIVLQNILPADNMLGKTLNSWGISIIAMLFVLILCACKIKNEPILNLQKIASKHVIWETMMLAAAALLLSTFLTADGTGVKELIIQIMEPVFSGRSVAAFSLIMVTIAIISTNIANNVVMGVMMMPIIVTYCGAMEMDPTPFVMIVLTSLYIAVLTPAASAFAAVLHSNKEWISTKNIYIYGGTTVVVTLIFYLLIGLPLANLLA